MVESIQDNLIEQFKQFALGQNINIPQEFIEQFTQNYLQRNQTFKSDYIYEWFGKQYYTRYDNFMRILNKLLPPTYFKICSSQFQERDKQSNKHGGQNKIIYDVTYKGMKLLAMHNDQQTALYYIELEDLIFRFFEQKQTEELKKSLDTIQLLKQKCVIYRINIYDETCKFVQKYYIGSTVNAKSRLRAHYYDSSNQFVNNLIKQGRKVTFTIMCEFEYLFKSERNRIEQRYIDQIPKEKLLNIQSPYTYQIEEEIMETQQVDPTSIVRQIGTQQINSNILIDTTKNITSIQEQQFNDINKQEKKTYEQNVQLLKSYIENNNRYPNKRDTDPQSQQLGYFLADCRSKYTNKNLYISDDKIQYMNEQIPDFVWNFKVDNFTKKVDDLAKFIETKGFTPRRNHKDADQAEKALGKFIAHIRESYKNQENPGKKVAYKLDNERLQYLLEKVPDFSFSVDTEDQTKQTVIRLSNYIRTNNRLPRRSGPDRDLEERTLGSFIHNLKYAIIVGRSTVPFTLQCLQQFCPEFNYKQEYNLSE